MKSQVITPTIGCANQPLGVEVVGNTSVSFDTEIFLLPIDKISSLSASRIFLLIRAHQGRLKELFDRRMVTGDEGRYTQTSSRIT